MTGPVKIAPGDRLKARGRQGIFVFKYVAKDGSLSCYGGGIGSGRSARPDHWVSIRPEDVTSVLRAETLEPRKGKKR